MTQLIVTPIDMTAEGSFEARETLLEAVGDLLEAQEKNDMRRLLRGYRAVSSLVKDRLVTDDQTPVETALKKLSAEQFDQLLFGLLNGAQGVPPSNTGS